MIALLPLLLLAGVSIAQKAINFTANLPDNYVLIPGDIIRLPVDDYVTLSGATVKADNPTQNQIIPKINPWNTIPLNQANLAPCELSWATNDYIVLVCGKGKYTIVKIGLDNQLGQNTTNKTTAELVAPGLSVTNAKCSDMVAASGSIYVACYDSGNRKKVYIFAVNINTLAFTVNICNRATIDSPVKLVPIITSNLPTASQIPFILYDQTVVNVVGSVKFTGCIIDTQSSSEGNAVEYDFSSLLPGDISTSGVLKYITSISNSEIMYAIAFDNATSSSKTVTFGVLNVSAQGVITKSNYNTTVYNGTNQTGFNPYHLAFKKVDLNSNNFIAVDKTNMYEFNVSYTKNFSTPTAMSVINLSAPKITLVDCGLSANPDTFVYRLLGDSSFYDNNRRIIVEYKKTSDFGMAGFAVIFGGKRFGCSSSSISAVQSATIINTNMIMTSTDDNLRFNKLSPNTMLSITVPTGATGKQEVTLTYEMPTYTSASAKFIYESIVDAKKVAQINIKNSNISTYSNGKFQLPLTSSNFIGNAPRFNTTNDNVKIWHSRKFTLDLNLTAATSDYNVHRIIAVDIDTFVAVLRRPMQPEAYIRFWSAWKNDELVITNSSALVSLAEGQYVFKIFKLGPNHFCILNKGTIQTAKKLTVICYEDKIDGVVSLNQTDITTIHEVSEVQFMEGSKRIDMLLVATPNDSEKPVLLHVYMELDNFDKVSPPGLYTLLIHQDSRLSSNYIIGDAMFDFWGDNESGTHITLRLTGPAVDPIVAKYKMDFTQNTPRITFLYNMKVESNDLAFCSSKNEMILYSPKTRRIMGQRWESRNIVGAAENKLFYPIKVFGIDYVQQFNCIPEKGIFQILGVSSNKKKYLVTYRGGESNRAGRRVHSIEPVEDSASFIESGFSFDQIITVTSTPGPATDKRSFVVVYPEGPLFVVDNTARNSSYDLSIKMTTDESTIAESKITITITNPLYFATPKANAKFDIKPNTPIYLDESSTINGPVMDMVLTGDDAKYVTVTKRNNKHKGYNPGETKAPNRVYVEKDYMVLQYTGTKVKILGDPTGTKNPALANPTEILSLTVNVLDCALIRYGTADEAILIVKTYETTSYMYSIYYLMKTFTTDNKPVYSYTETKNEYSSKIDFDSLQVTTIDRNEVVIAIRTKKAYVSNFIRMVAFTRITGNKFQLKSQGTIFSGSSKEIGWYSLVWNGKQHATVIANPQGFEGLMIANWDLTDGDYNFVESITQFKISDTVTRTIAVQYLKCFNLETLKVECVVDAEGIIDYMFDVILLDPMNTDTPMKDVITSITKKAEFEMPPMFEISRVDKSSLFIGFLLRKTSVNKNTTRLLQTATIDKFSDCDYLIAVYRPDKSKYLFTGITCSEWGGNTHIPDFAMEYDSREYVFFTKSMAPKTRLLQTAADEKIQTNFVSPIILTTTQEVNPEKIRMVFVGLNGQNSSENMGMSLDEFRKGDTSQAKTESSGSFWTWFFVIILILALAAGGYYAWIWYQKNQGTSDPSTYKKPADANTTKDDLEDTRL